MGALAELGAVREELGRERAPREAAEAERDELRLRLAEASVPPVVVVAEQESTAHPRARDSGARGLWRRVRGWARRGVQEELQ